MNGWLPSLTFAFGGMGVFDYRCRQISMKMENIAVCMNRLLLCCIFGLATGVSSFSAETNLWDEFLSVTVAHIKRDGPDSECADFISGALERSWARRFEFVELLTPYLEDKSPEKVAGAIEVLYRVRGYCPHSIHGMGLLVGDFEAKNSAFFADLDKQVYPHFDHFRELKSDRVYRALALYLGVSRTPQAKRELLEIAHSSFAAGAKEQALICLSWHRDPADMGSLFPFMLEDSPAARSLPYSFRNSYGEAALPYLRKALTEAKSEATRREAEKELRLLGPDTRGDQRIKTALEALHKLEGGEFDPIDALAKKLNSDPMWPNGEFPSISLSSNAAPKEVVASAVKLWGFDGGPMKTFEIVEVRKIGLDAKPGCSAALIQSDLGRKILLFRYERHDKTGFWWTRFYDAPKAQQDGTAPVRGATEVIPTPLPPPVSLKDAVRIAEDCVAEKKIDVSQYYLGSVRIQSDTHGRLFWEAQWMLTERQKGGWFIVRVQMDRTAALIPGK